MRAMKRLALGGRRGGIAGATARGLLGDAAVPVPGFVTGTVGRNPALGRGGCMEHAHTTGSERVG